MKVYRNFEVKERMVGKMQDWLRKILPSFIIKFLSSIRSGRYSYFFWLFPIKINKIIICNFYGNGYGDNSKYIVEEIISQGLNYDIVWLVKKDLLEKVEFPPQVRIVKYKSLKGLYELATAKIWIDNSRKFFYPPKRRNQFYIQTWHGGLGVKSVEKAAENKLSNEYISKAKNDSKMTNLMISNGKYITNLFKNSFWYDGEVLECGFPRNDILIQNSTTLRDELKRKLNIDRNVKLLLYAPTFRNETHVKDYLFDFDTARQLLSKRFGGDWVILFRLHPNITNLSDNIEYSDNLINASQFDDLQELLLISDAFMTDFSSCLSDYFLLKRPIFLYCSNYSDYIQERGFNIDIKTLGFPMAENSDELLKNIENFDMNECRKGIEYNYKRLGYRFNEHASRDIVDIVKSKIKN